ncbi:MAG: VanZ family protein [Thermoguttaceae bacterium]
MSRWRQSFFGAFVVCWVLATPLLLLPDPRWLFGGLVENDKPAAGWEHLVLFGVLATLMQLGRRDGIRKFVLWFDALVGYALVMEFAQILIPNRVFSWDDIAQNLAGIFIGVIIGGLLRRAE